MAETWTIVFSVAAVGLVLWVARRAIRRESVAVRLRLDRSAPGAHLMWDIANVGRGAVQPQPYGDRLATDRPARHPQHQAHGGD